MVYNNYLQDINRDYLRLFIHLKISKSLKIGNRAFKFAKKNFLCDISNSKW